MSKNNYWAKLPKELRVLAIIVLLITLSLCIVLLLFDKTKDTAVFKYAKESILFLVSGTLGAFLIVFIILLRSYKTLLSLIATLTLVILLVPGFYKSTNEKLEFVSDIPDSTICDTLAAESDSVLIEE